MNRFHCKKMNYLRLTGETYTNRYDIIVDKETGVNYLAIMCVADGRINCITPLLNSEGKVVIDQKD